MDEVAIVESHTAPNNKQTRIRRRGVRRGVATALAVGATAVGVGLSPGHADATPIEPGQPPRTLCSASSPYPNFPVIPVGSRLRIDQSGRKFDQPQWTGRRGSVNLELLSGPFLFLPRFDQTATFSWRNLDTGRTGTATGRTSVGGEVSIAYAENVLTGTGRVVVRVQTVNRGTPNTASSGAVTRGGCVGAPFYVY